MEALLTFLISFGVGFAWIVHKRQQMRHELDSCQSFLNEGRREVTFKGKLPWHNVQDENGDVDVMPVGEEHTQGKTCSCDPTVKIVSSRLVIIHNAFDHREIIEQAIAIMNGSELI